MIAESHALKEQIEKLGLHTMADLFETEAERAAKSESGVKRMALADPPSKGPRTVEVLHTEEKGSDVNLGTYLLVDAMDREYELAVVISNDSDLRLPIEMVRAKFGLQVGIFCPHETMSRALGSVAKFHKRIPARALAASQFPPFLHDAHGTITKPASW